MRSGFDIGRITSDGYLILPLSMSRLADGRGQDPEQCYEVLEYFLPKLEELSNDVVLLYTNGTYFHSDESSHERRVKLNEQLLNHSAAVRNLIHKRKQFMPNAFHFLPIDYIILNSPYFRRFLALLREREEADADFKRVVMSDAGERAYTDAHRHFILEEVAVTHILRTHLVNLPRTLVCRDIWRLFIYPGTPVAADAYVWQNGVLPKKETTNPYAGALYDYSQKQLTMLDDVAL